MQISIQDNWKKMIPLAAGMLGMLILSSVYIGLVTLAESFKHAIDLFWEDHWIIIPITVGFGI